MDMHSQVGRTLTNMLTDGAPLDGVTGSLVAVLLKQVPM